jgi:hypothetical protein
VPAYTPLLLFLRDHATAITEQPAISLGEIAQRHFTGDRYPTLRLSQGWFENQLQSSHAAHFDRSTHRPNELHRIGGLHMQK